MQCYWRQCKISTKELLQHFRSNQQEEVNNNSCNAIEEGGTKDDKQKVYSCNEISTT